MTMERSKMLDKKSKGSGRFHRSAYCVYAGKGDRRSASQSRGELK